MSKREHVHPVMLTASHYIGIAKVMAELEISKSYAILLAINEGLFYLKKITPEDYELLHKRYTKKLVDVIRENTTAPENTHTAVLEKEREKAEIAKLEKTFASVIDQWGLHQSPEWRQGWIEKANKHKDKVANARKLLEIVNPTER